jgi:small-conductance mechanosensitive channel
MLRLWPPLFLLFLSIYLFSSASVIHSALGADLSSLTYFEQAGGIFVWLSAAWLFNRLVTLIFWQGIVGHALGRNPPRLIIQLGGVIVFLLAISGIVRFVFGESITAIWAASGAIGIVVGFALRNLILDTFSGLAIHMERPFKVGDWITCHTRMGNHIGRVEETNWRTTRLWTTSRNIIIIPNSYLTTTLITNFSMPETQARFEMDFVLDFSVPTERAVRILSAALISTIGPKGPLASPAPKVRVNGTTEYGVQYRLRYFLEPADVSPSKARNTITQAVVKHITQAGLTLSYPRRDLFLARMPWRHKTWSYVKDQVHQLGGISLFKGLSDEDLEFIANHMSLHELNEDSVIVKQGDQGSSMYILAEGLLEVLIDQPDGTQIKVADLAPGTFFGEKSMLSGEPRSATIVCAAESIVCEITKVCMASLLERKPELAETLARAVVERDMHNELALSRATKEEVDQKISSVVGLLVSKIRGFFG